jgi:PAS domain S-box-containing protein
VGIYGAVRDITERKQAEEALRASEERFRRLFENSLVGIYRTTPEGRVEMANPALVAMLGYRSFEELARVNLEAEGFHPEYPRARFKALLERDGRVRGLESAWTRADGTTLFVLESAVAVRDATGRIVAYEGVVEDITERRRAEQALAEQVRDWQATFDAAADAIILLDPQQRIKRANRTAKQWFGQPPAAMQGQPCHQAVHGLREPPPFCPFGAVREHGNRQVVVFPHGEHWLELTVDPVWGPDGAFAGAVHYFRDITERRAAEQALREARQFARAVLDALPSHLCVLDEQGKILFTNAAWDRFAADNFGLAGRVGAGVNYLAVCEQAAREGAEGAREMADAIRALLAGAREGFVLEYPCHSPDRERWFAARASRFVLDGPPRVVLTHTDITERRRLEAQLLQAQKMEAIGRLAGGVAHDFNNILAVLLLQTELLLQPPDLPARVREGLDQMRAATERAANLTRQLLLFSRKQVLQPRDLDLNQVVSGMAKMIRRVIGEDIHFELQPAAEPLPLRADPGMIEQVLLNLAVNARDAMPRGGRLVVQTGACEVDAETARRHPEARPGWHVWLRVEDTGCGIPPEVLPHIFEPFFTTKPAGKGTGLGLATVYSVTRQHQGWIEVETEVGRGTAFQVFLPGAPQPAAAPPEPASGKAAPGGNETILLVEDDPVLREATRAVLESRGYTVLVAEDGMQALQLWAAHAPRVALLLTDLVMPGGVTGQELARVLLHERPNLKVVYTSGYSAEWSGTEPHLGPNERFLPKPCPAEQLLVTLRRCLDG